MCLPFSQYRLEIVPAKKQTMASTSLRFQSVGASDIDKFVNDQENKNTKKNICDMNLLKLFLDETQNEKRAIETIPPPELSDL